MLGRMRASKQNAQGRSSGKCCPEQGVREGSGSSVTLDVKVDPLRAEFLLSHFFVFGIDVPIVICLVGGPDPPYTVISPFKCDIFAASRRVVVRVGHLDTTSIGIPDDKCLRRIVDSEIYERIGSMGQ